MPLWGRLLGRGWRSQAYDRGIRYYDQGLFEEAIAAFKEALSEPKSGTLVQRLALFYLSESHSALAISQSARGAHGRAIENLEVAVSLNPHYADLHYHLGGAHLEQNNPVLAAESLRRALEINPGYARAKLLLGIALYLIGDRVGGFHRAHEAVTLEPTLDEKELLAQAHEADARDDTEGALGFLKRMAEAESDDAVFHARLALDLYKRGMHAEAVEEYRHALLIKPTYADLRNQLGITLVALSRNEEAEAEFSRAVQINPRYAEARLNHGLVLRRLGRSEDAINAFATVLDLDPDNTLAADNLNALRTVK